MDKKVTAHEHEWEIVTIRVTPDNPKFNHAADFILKKRKCTKCPLEQNLDYYKEGDRNDRDRR